MPRLKKKLYSMPRLRHLHHRSRFRRSVQRQARWRLLFPICVRFRSSLPLLPACGVPYDSASYPRSRSAENHSVHCYCCYSHNIHPFTILRRLVRRAFEFLPDFFVSIFIGFDIHSIRCPFDSMSIRFDIQPLCIKPCDIEISLCSIYVPYDLYSIETL